MIREWIGGLLGQRTERELDALVKAYTDQGKFSGVVLVARGEEILLRKAYGSANFEYAVANTPETVFRIGSMTKPFTALAIMQLVEAEKLSINDPVSKFLPDFSNGKQIALHHLLSNTSGIPDYIIMPEYQKISKNHLTTQDLIALFRDQPLQFEPGSQFSYSNSNWVLLGAILEQATGLTYGEVIRERIFQPLGMAHSGYEWEQPIIKNRAVGYVDTGAGMLNAELIDESTMHGAGGLYSTVDDLHIWERALHDGTLVRHQTLKQMSVPIFKEYGFGWELYSLHNRRIVAHSGGLPGYVSNFVRFVDDDVAIIILSNLSSAAFPQMTEALSAIVFDEPYQLPSAYTFIHVDPAVFADYVGDYRVTFFGRTSILKFVIEGDKLVMTVQGLPKSILSAISETKFYARSKGDVEMTFVRDEKGHISTIDMNWAGHLQTAVRVK